MASFGGATGRRNLVSLMTSVIGLLGAQAYAGDVWFVNSVIGTNAAGKGTKNSSPVATLDYAIGLATANKGHIIVVTPGHVENVSAASAITGDVAGVSILGQGTGRSRPTFTWTTTDGTIVVSAAAVRISNCVFDLTGIDAVVTGFTITGTGCEFDHNEIILANASAQCTTAITSAATADRLWIHDNKIHGTTDAGCAAGMVLVGGDDIVIENNYIHGAFTTSLGGIQNVTTAGLRWLIKGNTIVNSTASSTVCVTLVATTTGSVEGNSFSVLSGTAPVVGAALNFTGRNYYKAAAGAAAGTLL